MLYLSVQSASRALHHTWAWPNFSIGELACRCAGRFCRGAYWHAPSVLDRLQGLRDKVGRLTVRSGHRCPQWNAYVGGAPRSQHKQIAVDISLEGHDRLEVLAQARKTGFTGFGLARSFLHLDARERPAEWFYRGSEALWTN